jgi:hypothetical protein
MFNKLLLFPKVSLAMGRLLIIFLLLFLHPGSSCFSQTGYLFVKKGFKKKKTYTEGDMINLKLKDGSRAYGMITLLRNDSIFVNGHPIPTHWVKEVLLKRKPKKSFPDGKTIAIIGAGAAMTSAGLGMSKQATWKEAIIAGPVIGFGPLLIKHFGLRVLRVIPRGKFRIGKKFRLQVLDFHLPNRRYKSF